MLVVTFFIPCDFCTRRMCIRHFRPRWDIPVSVYSVIIGLKKYGRTWNGVRYRYRCHGCVVRFGWIVNAPFWIDCEMLRKWRRTCIMRGEGNYWHGRPFTTATSETVITRFLNNERFRHLCLRTRIGPINTSAEKQRIDFRRVCRTAVLYSRERQNV